MSKKYVIANWKMNSNWQATADFFKQLKISPSIQKTNNEIIICPPFPYLIQAKGLLENTSIKYGAQNISEYADGAYTGEISGAMLKDLGCNYVIIGHSERRMYQHESNKTAAVKILQAIQSDLTPILCVGESLAEREQGNTLAVIKTQISDTLTELTALTPNVSIKTLCIAYEPIWAIGTGLVPSHLQIESALAGIHEMMQLHTQFINNCAILYGGSVKSTNAQELFNIQHMDGFLVGGASLNVEEFIKIIDCA